MKQARQWPAALILIILATVSVSTQAPARLDPIEKIERAISSEMSRQNIPGMSVAIIMDGELRWSSGFGMSDLENYVPAKAATVYRLGSISKPITAAAVMQLAERGKLDLDAPIQKYVPSFPEKPWPITARQLLGHLSGIRHYKGNEIESTRHYDNLADGLVIFRDDPLLHEPGVKFSYTTYGYTLLGCALESASGMNFADFLRENIFKPARMDRMRVDDVFEIIPNRAQGYFKTQNGVLRNSGLADTSYKIPGGGLCSTVEDLAKFAIALQSGVLVKKETLEQMFTSLKTRAGKESGYGLGWRISVRDGIKEVSHGGGQQRVSTFLYMLPEKRFAVALMSNLEGARLQDLAVQIATLVLTR